VTRNGRAVKVRKTFKREAEASPGARTLLRLLIETLRPAKRDGRTVAGALAEFVEGMKSGEVRPRRRASYKPATVRSYDQHVRVRIADSVLGAIRVGEVARPDVQAFVDERLAAGDAPGTVANALCPVQASYSRAQDRGELGIIPPPGWTCRTGLRNRSGSHPPTRRRD
jgi:hypothetical protein